MKRILVAWYDRNAPGDYVTSPEEGDLWAEVPGNVTATLYGKPSLLTARVVEKETGNPVEGAFSLVIGPSLPALEKTNVGGWCNVEKEGLQLPGVYLVMAFKPGYTMAVQLVMYTGEPLQETIEMEKL
jgi:hypothetical protein